MSRHFDPADSEFMDRPQPVSPELERHLAALEAMNRSTGSHRVVRRFLARWWNPDRCYRVLDLCTGSGCLAILAAEAFPAAEIHACDISDDALAVADRNVRDYRLKARVRTFKTDLFDGLPSGAYDLIISNPPYVTAKAVEAFPPEYRAEPQIAHLGGADGLDLVRRILDSAGSRLTPNGTLIVEVGTGKRELEAARPDLPFLWLDTEDNEAEVFTLRAGDLKPAPTRKGKSTR